MKKHCETCTCRDKPGITFAEHGPNSHIGGCNFCNRHIDVNGYLRHAVLALGGAGLQARICRLCAQELLGALEKFAKDRSQRS
jgi:hypothetical protein